MKSPLVMLMVFALGLALGESSVRAQQSDEDLIPPEILKQFDPDIRSGKRPTVKGIRQEDIFGLREKPKLDADLVQFEFNPENLSTVQARIVREWVRAGHNVVRIYDSGVQKYGEFLGVGVGKVDNTNQSPPLAFSWGNNEPKIFASTLEKHPVNTDCSALKFWTVTRLANDGGNNVSKSDWGYFYVSGGAENLSVIVRGDGKGKAVCGSFTLGHGKVLFETRVHGTDSLRWRLNYSQWALGLPVPGATGIDLGGQKVSGACKEEDQHDSLTLKNGDTLTGDVQNKNLKIKTSYATLEFALDKIAKISFEGGTEKLDTVQLRTGDRLSGVVETSTLRVKLESGSDVELSKDKVKELTVGIRKGKP